MTGRFTGLTLGPLFEVGKPLPSIPHVKVMAAKFAFELGWQYEIENTAVPVMSAWARGWVDEDFLIKEVRRFASVGPVLNISKDE